MDHTTRKAGRVRAVVAQLAVLGLVAGGAVFAFSATAGAHNDGGGDSVPSNCDALQFHHPQGPPEITGGSVTPNTPQGPPDFPDGGQLLEFCKGGPSSLTSSSSATTPISYELTVSGFLVHKHAHFHVVDNAPPGVTFTGASGSPDWSCGVAPAQVICDGEASGSSIAPITINGTVAAGFSGTIHNCASLSMHVRWDGKDDHGDVTPATGDNEHDWNFEPLQACWDTTVTEQTTPSTTSDLSIFKAGPTSAQSGANVTYTITVTNNGPGASGTITVSDSLPAGTSFVSYDNSTGWSCGVAGNVLTCTHAGLASGASSSFSVNALVGSSAVNNILTNCAVITGGDTSGNAANNNSCTSTSSVVTQVQGETVAAAPVAVSPAFTG